MDNHSVWRQMWVGWTLAGTFSLLWCSAVFRVRLLPWRANVAATLSYATNAQVVFACVKLCVLTVAQCDSGENFVESNNSIAVRTPRDSLGFVVSLIVATTVTCE